MLTDASHEGTNCQLKSQCVPGFAFCSGYTVSLSEQRTLPCKELGRLTRVKVVESLEISNNCKRKVPAWKIQFLTSGKNNQRLNCSAGERYLQSTRNEKKQQPLEKAVGNRSVGLYWH